MSSVELRLTNLDEIDAVDLENEIRDKGINNPPLQVIESDTIPGGSYGEPGTVTALLALAPTVVPALATAIAVWIAKGKKKKKIRARKLIVSKGGISFGEFSMSDFEEANSAEALKKVLTDALKTDKES